MKEQVAREREEDGLQHGINLFRSPKLCEQEKDRCPATKRFFVEEEPLAGFFPGPLAGILSWWEDARIKTPFLKPSF